jgi:hypothetical protein
MGMKITKKGDNIIVETDYGAGFVDQESSQSNQELLKKYMKETGVDKLEGKDYYEIKDNLTKQLNKDRNKKQLTTSSDYGFY